LKIKFVFYGIFSPAVLIRNKVRHFPSTFWEPNSICTHLGALNGCYAAIDNDVMLWGLRDLLFLSQPRAHTLALSRGAAGRPAGSSLEWESGVHLSHCVYADSIYYIMLYVCAGARAHARRGRLAAFNMYKCLCIAPRVK